MPPKIYIIIVTYNAMKWAERCFSSLRKSSVPVHTIVVDNGSTDGTQDFIKNNFPEVDFIQSPENLGFGKANNIGIEKAYKQGADFIYLMNQDAWIFEDSFEKMLEVYNQYPNKEEIGIISPMHLDGSGKKLDIFLDKYIAQNFENRFISDICCNNLKSWYEIKFVNAAHWFIPKSTVEKVGGFNPYFFHYGEDNEYINRVHYHNKKVLLAPQSKVIHDGKQELDKVDPKKYLNLSIETRIMNPALNGMERLELKSLTQSILKNFAMGKAGTARELLKRQKSLRNEIPKLISIRNELRTTEHPFLNIPKK